jgi:APA family basic amino acid/polyamine antiporter
LFALMGELVAFIIGWDLILEYGVSVAAVAVGWGGNVNAFLDSAFNVRIPDAVSTSPEDGGVFNLPAVFIVLAITFLLIRGTKESATANMVMVGIKICILVFFIIAAIAAITSFDADNFKDFSPHGFGGITSAAGLIFFAYIGFDAVATGSEESNDPGKDLPIAVVGSLVISTVLYILVAVAAVGVAPISVMTESKNSDAPLSAALEAGTGLDWASTGPRSCSRSAR